MKNVARLSLVLSYLAIRAISLLVFWIFTDVRDAFGYSVMFELILLPVTTLTVSLLIGIRDDWGHGKWFAAIAFGVMYLLADYATFRTANMVAFRTFTLPTFSMLPVGAAVSLVGLGVGTAVRYFKQKRQ